jgi:hypothetical protein
LRPPGHAEWQYVTITVALALGLAIVSGVVLGAATERLRSRAAAQAVMRVNRAAVIRRRGWQTSGAARNIASIVQVIDGLAGRRPSVRSLSGPETVSRAMPNRPAPLGDRTNA